MEVDAEKTYIYTCYGTAKIEDKTDPENDETVTTKHHDHPLFIYNVNNRIESEPMINHIDPELVVLEKLVGRIPPW